MATSSTDIRLTLATLACLLTSLSVQASAIKDIDAHEINFIPQAEPFDSPAGDTPQEMTLNYTGGADIPIDNGLITTVFNVPKRDSKFSRKKMWFVRRLNEGVYVAGQLTPRQIKYAADSGFKSIVSIFTHSGKRSPKGKRLVISTSEEKKIVENFSGMKFFTVLQKGDDWYSVKAVERMTNVYPQLEFPALLHCERSVSVTLITLLYYANQTLHDPLFEPRVDSERFYYITRQHGLDFVELFNETLDTVKEITGEDLPDTAVKPNMSLPLEYWQSFPVYAGWYIAGQIQQRDLGAIKAAGVITIVNVRAGLTHNGKPFQETVELINIKSGTPTYATSKTPSRQSKRGLQGSIIDSNKPTGFIGKSSKVNYESRSPSEFGDNIGYNEQIERAAVSSVGVDYAHMPLGESVMIR